MKRKLILITCLMVLGGSWGIFQSDAWAFQHIKGSEAKQYVGDIKSRFTNGSYSYEVLKRSHRDSMNARQSDAVIFNRQGEHFLYKKRSDGNHLIVLNDPQGRVENPVTANPIVWNPIANTLNDDHPHSHVFLDNNGQEIAVVFIGRKTSLKGKINENGLLELTIKVKQVRRERSRGFGARL